VIDGRRGMPETDPFIVYGNQQLARITEHDSKAIWSDRFERRQFPDAVAARGSRGARP
jgi:hypothetical protein